MKTSTLSVLLLIILLSGKTLSQSVYYTQADTAIARSLFVQAVDLEKRTQYDSAITLFDSTAKIYLRANSISDHVNSLIKKADCLKSKASYDKAIDAIRIGSDIEQKLLNVYPLMAAQRLVMLGSILREQGKYGSLLAIARDALSITQDHSPSDRDLVWDIYTLFAGTYFSIGEHDSALTYNHRALQLFPSPNEEQQLKISASLNSIAGIYETRGDYQKALDYYIRSLDIRRPILGEKHPDIANLYNNIAAIYFRMGDNDLALEYYFKSLSIMNEILEADNPAFGVRYNNIAMAYRGKNEFEKALEFGERSKNNFIKKLGDKHPNVAGVVNNIGRTYSDMKYYQKALDCFHEALAVWKAKLGAKHPYISQCYFNIGEAYGKLRDYEKAKEWLDQSLSLRRETLGEINVKVAQSYNGLGSIYANWGKPDSALYYYQQSIRSLVDGFIDSSIFANPQQMKSISDLDLLVSLSSKGKLLFTRGSNKRDIADLTASLDSYEKATQRVEIIRRGFGTEGSKVQLNQITFNVYEQAILVSLKLFELTKNNIYTSAAFSFAERGKAGILSEAISEANAKKFGDIPDSLLNQESSLRVDLNYYETQIQKEKEKKEKGNTLKITQWENIVFDLHRKYESLIQSFENNYPNYYSLTHQSTTVSLAEVQKNLPDNKTALLEYVVGDSSMVLFTITKNQSIVKSLSVSSTLADIVKQFRRSIQNVDVPNYLTLASSLYSKLIGPIKSNLRGINKLYIIPDGILNYLTFEPLLTKAAKTSANIDFSQLPYLIKEFEISYQVSAKFLFEKQKNVSFYQSNGFVGVAPVFADRPQHASSICANILRSDSLFNGTEKRVMRSRTIDGEQFSELKESGNEVKNIFNLFETHRLPSKIFLHSDATESILKSSDIQTYRFIHIATHGIINEESPKLSAIIFAAPDKSSSDDGILYSGEIYNLKLNADLVVLSACETGLGTIVKGEGMLGLTRGFMYAGANNLLVSLWQVADKSTAELMTQFYRNILNGQSYSAALRSAKIMMIKNGKYSHPVEWSPFVLSGK